MNNDQNIPTNDSVAAATTQRRLSLKKMILIGAGVVLLFTAASVIFVYLKKSNQQQDNTQQTSAPIAERAEVAITDDGFMPGVLRVKTGTSIVWTNVSSKPRHIAADPYPEKASLPELDSNVLAKHQEFVMVFNTPGTYRYHDFLSPTTVGTIIVN